MTAPAHRLPPVTRDRVRVRTPSREQNCIQFGAEVNPFPELDPAATAWKTARASDSEHNQPDGRHSPDRRHSPTGEQEDAWVS